MSICLVFWLFFYAGSAETVTMTYVGYMTICEMININSVVQIHIHIQLGCIKVHESCRKKKIKTLKAGQQNVHIT